MIHLELVRLTFHLKISMHVSRRTDPREDPLLEDSLASCVLLGFYVLTGAIMLIYNRIIWTLDNLELSDCYCTIGPFPYIENCIHFQIFDLNWNLFVYLMLHATKFFIIF